MNTAAGYFFFGFCICFVLGAWQGRLERNSTTDEELQTQTALAHMQVTREEYRDVTMNYLCNAKVFFSYDFETNELRELEHPTSKASILSYEGVERVFEAATGYKLYETVRAGWELGGVTEAFTGKRIWLVVGSLSGYFAGHAVGAWGNGGCDSSTLIGKLRDMHSPLWIRVRREYLRTRIGAIAVNADGRRERIIESKAFRDIVNHNIADPNFRFSTDSADVKRPAVDFYRLEQLWDKLANTSFDPQGKDCYEIWDRSYMLARRLYFKPGLLKPAYPNAKKIRIEYTEPVDPSDPMAMIAQTASSFLSTNLVLLTVGGCLITLACLAIGFWNQKRLAAANKSYGFVTQLAKTVPRHQGPLR